MKQTVQIHDTLSLIAFRFRFRSSIFNLKTYYNATWPFPQVSDDISTQDQEFIKMRMHLTTYLQL